VNEILSAVLALLPPKRKSTPSGWTSFNAVCCQHNSERVDTRQRGGIMTSPEGGFQYHCFNCNFKAGWSPGKLFSKNTKNLLRWLGMNDSDIGKLGIIALKLKDEQPITKKELVFELNEKSLPEMTLTLQQWAMSDLPQDIEQDLLKIFQYLDDRGMDLDWYPWHWSYSPGYRDRVLIPFYHQDRIVGYTGRKITPGKPKYLTDAQPGYVFNLDRQIKDRAFVIVVEGQFDAIAIDGCAIGHNEPSDVQIMRINALNREVIVVPDRDRPGAKMLQIAIEQGWTVSVPPWDESIKDVADAVKTYGRLYTLATILHYKETNEIKIQLLKKKLESLYNE